MRRGVSDVATTTAVYLSTLLCREGTEVKEKKTEYHENTSPVSRF